MARRILQAGFPLTVWNRHPERARAIEGAAVAGSPREAAAAADVVCTMLSDPAALEAVAGGPDGLVAGLSSGKIWLDFSTVTPAASRRAAELAREKGADFCDVPVAGSVKPAADGTLRLLAGGDGAVLAKAKGVLDAVSTETLHFGGVGTGLGDEAREQPDVRRGTRHVRRSPAPRREAGPARRARHGVAPRGSVHVALRPAKGGVPRERRTAAAIRPRAHGKRPASRSGGGGGRPARRRRRLRRSPRGPRRRDSARKISRG